MNQSSNSDNWIEEAIKNDQIKYYEYNQFKKYMMVIEYADGGSLKNYLKNNFSILTWEDKYRLAYQIAMALECLHNEGIVHHDLVVEFYFIIVLMQKCICIY